MKTKILIISLIIALSSIAGVAQKYESCFGEESTKWVIVKPNSYWGIDGNYSLNIYLIDSMKCYSDYYNKEQPFGIVFFESDENSKLWRWDTEKNEKSVIMDLNWEIGDSIFIGNNIPWYHYTSNRYGIVDSVYYDEHNRKNIRTDLELRTDTTRFKLTFIEGIGPNSSMYYQESHGFFWDSSHLLLCAYKDGVLSYINTKVSSDCTYKKPVSVDTKNASPEVTINYHSNTIDLAFNDTFSGKLCLISSNGKIFRDIAINCRNKRINIGEIPVGVYIIQVTNRNGKLCSFQKINKK